VDADEELPDGERQESIEEAWYREIERRASELDSGTAETIPWKLVRARLRSLRN
jgi:putative addiction module component (TIGR02574 family)